MTMNHSINYKRQAFRLFNYWMVFLWRLGLGALLSAWPGGFGTYMVITHRGRKSGRQFRTPVNFAEVNGEIYCLVGFGEGSDWYQNVLQSPQVEIWLPGGWFMGLAEETDIHREQLPIVRSVFYNSGFVARMMGLDPLRISDAELLELSKDYRLIRVRRVSPRTGAGGPGDLIWLWPLFFLVGLIIKPRKRK